MALALKRWFPIWHAEIRAEARVLGVHRPQVPAASALRSYPSGWRCGRGSGGGPGGSGAVDGAEGRRTGLGVGRSWGQGFSRAERCVGPAVRAAGVGWVFLLVFLVVGMGMGLAPALEAATVVKVGAVVPVGHATDLDLEGDFVYAINFSADDPPRTVRGVTFLPDTQAIAGATLVGPQQVTPWQIRPELGDDPDDDELEEILHDIRWANNGGGERLRATLEVTPGEEYKLQILFSGNTPENRRWDIRVAGQEAVDEVTSLGVSPGESYAVNRATVYTCQIAAGSTPLVVEMGDLFGAHDGGDRNPIWQALTLERVTVPPTPDAIGLAPDRFFPSQSGPVGVLRVTDRKFGAVHRLSLVAGAGDTDNGKFRIEGAELVPGAFDFGSVPVGTVFSIRVRATDVADGRRWLEWLLTLTVVAPHAPTGLALDVASLSTMAQPGALVARVRVEDEDDFDRHGVALVAGAGDTDNGLFAVVGGALHLARGVVAGTPSALFRLRATDRSGLVVERSFLLPFQVPQVRVNEVVASPVAGVLDEWGVGQDWVELVNEGSQHVDLAGWFLTDRRGELRRWMFPSSPVGPQGYVVVLADGRGAGPEGSGRLHAGFSLAVEGEWVGLVRPDGETVASGLEFPAQYPGVAFGYGSDGRVGHLPHPTPGGPNGAVAEAGANEVAFSRSRGFYGEAFELTLRATLAGSEIRYTLDGTAPTRTTGAVYTQPLVVRPSAGGGTRGVRMVRALAVHAGAAYAPVATQTYLFVHGVAGPAVDGIVGQSHWVASVARHPTYGPLLGEALLALPAVSVVVGRGPDQVERWASVELFDPEGREPGFQIDCGLEVTGTSSLSSPKLSLAAHFRSDYGQATLRYPVFGRGSLFPEGAATEFDELRLRSHSHDTFFWLATRENPPVPYGDPPVTRSGDAQYVRNVWMDEMQLAMGQPGKHGRQVHLYLNGAYHGIYHVHEHATDAFLASYYAGGREAFHFTTAGNSGSTHGALDTWRETWEQVKASTDDWAEAQRWIDLTNLCDYMLLCFYAGNDWDWWVRHNWAAAGPQLPDRGGWKFFAQDSDLVLQDVGADCTDQDVPDGLFQRLMRFADFRVLFRDRVYRHCYGGGVLTPAEAGARYDTRMNEIATAVVAETARWQPGSSVGTLPWDRDQEWANEWRYLRETFFPQRTARVLEQLRRRGWWPVEPPSPSHPGGTVPGGVRVTYEGDRGTVYVTTDGTDPRLEGGEVNPAARALTGGAATVSLIAAGSGWRFLDDGTDPGPGWVGEGFDDTAWRSGLAEVGYGDGNEATVAGYVDTDPEAEGVQKNLTTYFRRTFDLAGLSGVSELKLRLLRDDGAVVYLNGQEIWRTNLPAGPVTSATPALTAVERIDEFIYLERTMSAAGLGLRAEGNVVAVEIHQHEAASPDISFDLALSGVGIVGGQGILVDRPTLVRARTRTGSEWSALVETYYVPEGFPRPTAGSLALTEVHYHPQEASEAEFLEFANASAAAMDLSGVQLAEAVSYRFPLGTVLEAGASLVVAKDLAVFGQRYGLATSPYYRPGLRVLGPWEGSLSNGGEALEVRTSGGELLFGCAYGAGGRWPVRADGYGSSLELVDWAGGPATVEGKSVWLSDPRSWRPSGMFHGSPGIVGATEDPRVVINEVMASPADGQGDAIELLNVGGAPVDLSDWWLSDSVADYRKYRFPAGSVLAAGGRRWLRESDFNAAGNPANPRPFALSSQGEEVVLVRGDRAGVLLRFEAHVEFGPTPRGVSLGRFPDGTGPVVWLEAPSLGGVNGLPIPGYEAWAATAFPVATASEDRGPEVDGDGDGWSNFAEYAFGLSPDRADGPALGWLAGAGEDGLRFVYRVRTAAPDLRYQVEVSADLRTWDRSGVEVETLSREPQADGSTLVTARVRGVRPGLGTARFVRVEAR